MTLDYYRIFYYVAKYKSFSKAAKILHNNQPNISRTMNNIESEFGCKLLVRSHSGITLTPEGEQLYEHVAIAIEQLYQGESEILSNKTLEHGHISIGVSETALNIFLLSKLEHFHKAYPHVKIKLSNHSSIQAVDALEKGIVDIAVVTSPINIKKPLHTTSLYCFEEILIGGKEYESLSNEILDIQQIALSIYYLRQKHKYIYLLFKLVLKSQNSFSYRFRSGYCRSNSSISQTQSRHWILS